MSQDPIPQSVDASITILVVDDSATDRTRAEGLLKKANSEWKVRTADSGKAALQIVRDDDIDIVLTDLQMPEVDGRQLLAQLNESQPGLPVVLMTALGDDQVAAECLALGATNYLPKRRLGKDLADVVREVAQEARESRLTGAVLQHVVNHQLQFEIESRLDQIRSLANLIQQRLASTRRLEANQVFQVSNAVREALLNAHFHGNLETNRFPLELSRTEYRVIAKGKLADPELSARRIRLKLNLTADHLEVEIEDDGPGFDSARLPSLDDEPTDEFPNGNGIRSMRIAMDEMIFHPPGNRVTLRIGL